MYYSGKMFFTVRRVVILITLRQQAFIWTLLGRAEYIFILILEHFNSHHFPTHSVPAIETKDHLRPLI